MAIITIRNIKKYVILSSLLAFASVGVQLAAAESQQKWRGLSQEQLIGIAEKFAAEADTARKAYVAQMDELTRLRDEVSQLTYENEQATSDQLNRSVDRDELIEEAHEQYRELERTSRAQIADLEKRLAVLRQDKDLEQSQLAQAEEKIRRAEGALAEQRSKSDSLVASVARLEEQLLSQQTSQSQTAGSRALESAAFQEQANLVLTLQARLSEVEQLSQLQAAALKKLEEQERELQDQNDQLLSQLSMQQSPDALMVGARADSPTLQEELTGFGYAAMPAGLDGDAAVLAALREEVGAILAPQQHVAGTSEVDRSVIDLQMEMTKLNAAKETLEREKRTKEAQLKLLGNSSGDDSSLPDRSVQRSGSRSSAFGLAKDISKDAPEMGLLAGVAAFGKSLYDSRQRTATAKKLQEEVAALNVELAQVNTNRSVYGQNQQLMRVLQKILPTTIN